MSDQILIERLDALKKNLSREMQKPDCWLCFEFEKLNINSDSEVLKGLCKAIQHEANLHMETVKNIRKSLERDGGRKNTTKAWEEYRQVYRQSRRLFNECLEVIGGLAYRNMGLDAIIYKVADELIRNCKSESGIVGDLSPTVPALPETMVKMMAHIIGLGFPEWTIWSLPFTAHELGHVMIIKHPASKQFIDNMAEEQGVKQNRKKRVKNHLEELLADAFASYTLGPAYACAAVRLGFNPLAAHQDTDKCPAGVKRARVVFAILDRLHDGEVSPFNPILKVIRKDWEEMLERAGMTNAIDHGEAKRLDALIEQIWELFNDELFPNAKYFSGFKDKVYGWGKAEKWSEQWASQANGSGELPAEGGAESGMNDVNWRNTLRDVLNAAWLCRLTTETKADVIEKSAQNLCERIIEARRAEELMKKKKPGESTHETMRWSKPGGQS
jgi:hypothetical protein